MTTRRISFALTLAAVTAISAGLLRVQLGALPAPGQGVQELAADDIDWQEHGLEGSWVIIVAAAVPPGVPPPPVRTNYTTFARGGVSIGSDRLAPFANPQHGVWKRRGGHKFLWTFRGDNFSPMGVFLGTLQVRNQITLTGPDIFVGVNTADVRDASGNLLFSRCNTIRGQRIKIESPTPQCLSITPPH